MSDLYLIAHKVRGEPAFDVAVQIICPECADGLTEGIGLGCNECDGNGYWWIVSTSGHRAYPYWHKAMPIENLSSLGIAFRWVETDKDFPVIIHPPANWPDHYQTRATPDKPKLNIAALIPSIPIRRRV